MRIATREHSSHGAPERRAPRRAAHPDRRRLPREEGRRGLRPLQRRARLRRAAPVASPESRERAEKGRRRSWKGSRSPAQGRAPRRRYRQVAQSARAWRASPRERREFLSLVKASIRAPTSAVAWVEESALARVLARVAKDAGLRRELNARIPPIVADAAQAALARTPAGKAARAALDVLAKIRPR